MTPLTTPVVTAEQFWFRYTADDDPRLKDITFSVMPGEFVAVIGPSGGGKSTLSMAVNGIIPHEWEQCQTSGRVFVGGMDTREHKPQQLVLTVGTVLQDPEWQLIRPTVEDELVFGMENIGVPVSEMRERLAQVVRLFGIEHMLERQPEDLSGGEKQRVAIAAAFAMQPQVLVLDEATAELDPAGKESLLDAVRYVNRTLGTAVIFIDHNLELVVPTADRVLVVANGELRKNGTPREVMADTALLTELGFDAPQVSQLALAVAPTMPAADLPITPTELSQWLDERDVPLQLAEPPQAETGTRDTVLTVSDVGYQYPGTGGGRVSHVTFTVQAGDFIGIVGRNGAGKSTLSRLCAGLLAPQQGDVAGVSGSFAKAGQLNIVKQVAYVFQNPDYQFFESTVMREVSFGLRLQKVTEDEIASRVQFVLERLGIWQYRDEHPHFLSRGERRRVAIASVLALRPPVLILDEPTTGLDQAASRTMNDLIADLTTDGHAIMMATHDMRVVAERCTRVLVMHDGELVADVTPAQLFADQQLLTMAALKPPPLAELSELRGLSTPLLTVHAWLQAMPTSIDRTATPS